MNRHCVLTFILFFQQVESHGVHGHSSPPSPSPTRKPVKVLNEGWEEYKSSRGRTYYYNCRTHDKSWKPPRRHHSFQVSVKIGSAGHVSQKRELDYKILVEIS